jgi:hypothetical protein
MKARTTPQGGFKLDARLKPIMQLQPPNLQRKEYQRVRMEGVSMTDCLQLCRQANTILQGQYVCRDLGDAIYIYRMA